MKKYQISHNNLPSGQQGSGGETPTFVEGDIQRNHSCHRQQYTSDISVTETETHTEMIAFSQTDT